MKPPMRYGTFTNTFSRCLHSVWDRVAVESVEVWRVVGSPLWPELDRYGLQHGPIYNRVQAQIEEGLR